MVRLKKIKASITEGLSTWWHQRKYFDDDWFIGSDKCFVQTSSMFVNKSVITKFDFAALFD